jgi:hypothetical protein
MCLLFLFYFFVFFFSFFLLFCILFSLSFFLFLLLADSMYRPPSLFSLMRIIGWSMSVVPHAGKILLEMLTVDSHWELDTVQLLKHICISGQDLINFIRPMPI